MDSFFSSDDINKKMNQFSKEQKTDIISQNKKQKSDILNTNYSSTKHEKK